MPSLAARLALVALASTLVAASPSDHPSRSQALSGGATAVEDWARAMRSRSPEGVAATLTADFRAHPATLAPADYVTGLDRDLELDRVTHLLRGVESPLHPALEPATDVRVAIDGITETGDPEHPDSTDRYRLLVVARLTVAVRRSGGDVLPVTSGPHAVQVVRGDAARLPAGAAHDPQRWYVRRWFDDLTAFRIAMLAHPGVCPPESAATVAAGTSLTLHPVPVPACPRLHVRCDLPIAAPAQVQVRDARGRLVSERVLAPPTPGTYDAEAGAGVTLVPGAYWVRVVQGANRSASRLVVVGR